MNWNELYIKGINVENITRNSEEFQSMFSAAEEGIPSAQYCLGLWAEKVYNETDTARIWLRKAAQQGFKEAIETIPRLEVEQGLTSENTVEEHLQVAQMESVEYEHIGADNQSSHLVFKEHNFQSAKNSLLRHTERAKEKIELGRVPTKGGIFNLGDHKVEGSELNNITSQIQDYLISLNALSQGFVDEFGEVYKAFEALDKDYISGIVASIEAAEKVSKQEQKDRKDIKELVDQHEQSVAVLKKFKVDIDKRVNKLTQKLKLLYIVAGGATALAVIQLLLNIFGVI